MNEASLKAGASMARGRSNQVVGTPREFLDAVEARFGKIVFDLAATKTNTVTGDKCFFGPGSEFGEDALNQDWYSLVGTLWLNPPYSDIAPWAAKLALNRHRKGWTIMLVPASVGSNWFAENEPNCYVSGIRPRLIFVGSTTPYPKDLMLMISGFGIVGRESWKWK